MNGDIHNIGSKVTCFRASADALPVTTFDRHFPTVILRGDALAAGYDDREIRRLKRNDTWRSIRRGGYLPAPQFSELDARGRHEALIRATIPALRLSAVVSHTSAAVMLGLPLWATRLGLVSITRRPGSTTSRSACLKVHAAALDADEDTTDVGGITVTNATRTVVDLGRTLPFEQAIVAADGALRMGMTTRDLLLGAVERVSGTPGSRSARRVIVFADGLSESVGESRSRVMIHRAGLPPPALQHEVTDHLGRPLGRADFAWRDGRLLGEFDGRVKYGKLLRPGENPSDVVFQEKRREDALRDNGARVVRWVWEELDRPDEIAQRIRRGLAAVEGS